MIKIFIGYDPRQRVTYNVLQQSIINTASQPVAITPLVIETLPITRTGLTPFTYSRFLVPWLCDYQGWALFLDADMLLAADVAELWGMRDEQYAALVSKNRLRFEWASAVLYNCAHPSNRVLTPEYVSGADKLHGLGWLKEGEIGEFPGEWNHLVGYDPSNPEARLIHYTQGVPAFPETRDTEHAELWHRTARQAMSTAPWAALMGQSVHAQPVYERLSKQRKETA